MWYLMSIFISNIKSMLTLLDSFTGNKKVFIPNDPDNVTIYICGPTVYDDAHLGHARTYVTFDLIRRILSILGYHTTVVMNITDIDDKIIIRSEEKNISPAELSHMYETRFMEDMASLGVEPPNVLTRVTDHLDEIITFIQDLIDKDYAYEKDGDIRFNLANYSNSYNYPGFHVHETEITSDDKDFALWKSNTKGLKWKSPWGDGRPGWHIECSAMATHIFGNKLDIHVGGIDLAFPHHANEIAQSQARSSDTWVNTFLHTGHLSIEGQKMSKSLKNFITVREALQKYNPQILRMYFALHKYNSPISFSHNELDRAKNIWDSFQSFWRKVNGLPSEIKWTEKSRSILNNLIRTKKENTIALHDDLNLPLVILNLTNLISLTHSFIEDNIYPIAAKMVVKYTQNLLQDLGFPVITYTNNNTDDIIQTLVDFRSDVRKSAGNKQQLYTLTDTLRNETLPKLGIKLEDQGNRSYWSLLHTQ